MIKPMLGKTLRRYFLTGIFVLLPLAATWVVISWLFHFMDNWALPITQRLFGYRIPGLGLFVTLGLILLAGALSSNVVGRYLLKLIDYVFMELPVFRAIYNTTKQVMQIFSPQSQASFRSVVLVEHPRGGGLSLGFVTSEVETTEASKKEKRISVYVPTNHLYLGDLFLFKPEEVRMTSLTVQQGIQSIISAGATLPGQMNLHSLPAKDHD